MDMAVSEQTALYLILTSKAVSVYEAMGLLAQDDHGLFNHYYVAA